MWPPVATAIIRRVVVPLVIGRWRRALFVAWYFAHWRRRVLRLALRQSLGWRLELWLRWYGARCFAGNFCSALGGRLARLRWLTILLRRAITIPSLFVLNRGWRLHFAHRRRRTLFGARCTGHWPAVVAISGMGRALRLLGSLPEFSRGGHARWLGMAAARLRRRAALRRRVARLDGRLFECIPVVGADILVMNWLALAQGVCGSDSDGLG